MLGLPSAGRMWPFRAAFQACQPERIVVGKHAVGRRARPPWVSAPGRGSSAGRALRAFVFELVTELILLLPQGSQFFQDCSVPFALVVPIPGLSPLPRAALVLGPAAIVGHCGTFLAWCLPLPGPRPRRARPGRRTKPTPNRDGRFERRARAIPSPRRPARPVHNRTTRLCQGLEPKWLRPPWRTGRCGAGLGFGLEFRAPLRPEAGLVP